MVCEEESNYPENPNIILKDVSQTYKYLIIKEGVYPPKHKLKYTRHPAKHPIPHNYIVRTMYSKKNYVVECSVYYVDNKPLYQIHFGKYLEKFVESDRSTSHAAHLYCKALSEDIPNKSKLSGPLLFGLRCKSVEAVHKTIPSNEFLQESIEEEKENFFHPNDNIVLKQVKFEINDCAYNINYGKIDKQLVELQTQAIVKSIDRGQISQEAYRSLARIDESLIRAGAVYDMRQEITRRVNEKIPISLVDIDQPTIFEPITEEPDITDPTIVFNVVTTIGKGGHRRITDILNYIIPLYVQKEEDPDRMEYQKRSNKPKSNSSFRLGNKGLKFWS
ncbi:12770_t:CDS:2, partial [Dentiscutata heterogama]